MDYKIYCIMLSFHISKLSSIVNRAVPKPECVCAFDRYYDLAYFYIPAFGTVKGFCGKHGLGCRDKLASLIG